VEKQFSSAKAQLLATVRGKAATDVNSVQLIVVVVESWAKPYDEDKETKLSYISYALSSTSQKVRLLFPVTCGPKVMGY